MATYLLDTSVIIDAPQREAEPQPLPDRPRRARWHSCLLPDQRCRVYAGLRPKEEQKTATLLHSLQLYPITFPVAELAGRLKRDYGQRGKTLSIPDTVIAAVALHYHLTLVTDNAGDFPMPELSVHSLPD